MYTYEASRQRALRIITIAHTYTYVCMFPSAMIHVRIARVMLRYCFSVHESTLSVERFTCLSSFLCSFLTLRSPPVPILSLYPSTLLLSSHLFCDQSEMLKEIKVHLQDAAKREERLTLLEGSQEKLATLIKEREQLRQENEQVGASSVHHLFPFDCELLYVPVSGESTLSSSF